MDKNQKYTSVLKAQRTKLLKQDVKSQEEFEDVQAKLDIIEFELKRNGGE